jgi:hypothetical protein
MALSLTWGGRADTHVSFSEFFAGNHTVAARFMLQFVNAYAGPMLAVHGGAVGRTGRLARGGEFQIYDAPYAAYRARYDELWPQGWRLKVFDRFTA